MWKDNRKTAVWEVRKRLRTGCLKMIKKGKQSVAAKCGLVIAVFLMMCGDAIPALAADYWPEGPEVASSGAIVMEMNAGTLLYEKDSLQRHYPASITKIMTTLVALENCSDLSEVVTFSDEAIDNTTGSGIARDYGEQMTMEHCLYAVMLESANECAYAVAEHVGGTVGQFVKMMNEKAEELNCQNTHFVNPHGLHDENHYTCAYDMALIAKAAYENETFRIITGTARYTIPPTNKHDDSTLLQNHNELLYPRRETRYVREYCTGGKTGYTDAANSTLVTYAEKDGMTLVCVVMDAQSPNQWTDTINLFEYCFDNFQIFNIKENEMGYTSPERRAADAVSDNRPFVDIDEQACILLPKTAEFKDAVSEITYEDKDKEIVGTISYTYAGRIVGKADIVTTGVEIEGYVFNRQQKTESTTEQAAQGSVSTFHIKPQTLAAAVGIIAVLAVLGIFVKKFADNYYIIRHNMEVRRNRRMQSGTIKRKRRRHKRRR